MMRQYELVERVQRYNPRTNEALLNKAYVYAMRAHGQQKRASGDPYFSHPLEVAAILTSLRLDDATIAAALLHDTVEDTEATLEEIEAHFGPEICRLVAGLTKINRLDLVSKKAAQAENLRRLILAVSDDIRVLLVKLADRLHNMRTLHFMAEAKRPRIAEETIDIYAPLAGRIGMQEMREELEDLSFRWLHPDAYQTIVSRLEAQQNRFANVITEIECVLTRKLQENGIEAKVSGRAKKPYAIWRKMERKSISFEQLSDVLGFRTIVGTVPECYQTLGLIHTQWPMVPGRFKDYVSTPKQNDYRSIHTTVIGPGHQRVELQIRTADMHRIAEYGVAAHALYKDSERVDVQETRAYQWLRELVELIEAGDSPEDFLEHTKLELFQDQVFCFTPKGRLIALPRGATPIDFAYAVHTDVGNSCVGCKINGRASPLMSQLENGDEVEIVRGQQKAPPAAWESLVVTGKARAAIRRATREAVRVQYGDLGRQILDRIFRKAGKTYGDDLVKPVLPRLARHDVLDVLVAVGRGEMPPANVLHAVHPELERKSAPLPKPDEGWFGLRRAIGLNFRFPGLSKAADDEEANGLPIRGVRSDMPVRFAPASGAVPGDRIVGIMTPGEGITVFPIHARELKRFEERPELWLDVRWDPEHQGAQRFPAQIKVTARNEPGTLAQIAQVIAEADGNIDNVKMVARSSDYHEMLIDLEVWDLKHLVRIISTLRDRSAVSDAVRASN
jgi:guanosine-3',5'-bis(diphosphate) 3'-pyrophosphohydrolase